MDFECFVDKKQNNFNKKFGKKKINPFIEILRKNEKEIKILEEDLQLKTFEIRDNHEIIIDLENQIYNLKTLLAQNMNFQSNENISLIPISEMNDDKNVIKLREKYIKNLRIEDPICKNACFNFLG